MIHPLRDLRKSIRNNEAQLIGQNVDGGEVMSSFELEELCLAMLDELPELSYDYLGNTIVQNCLLWLNHHWLS